MPGQNLLSPGMRIQYQSSIGTIRYAGTLKTRDSALYYGIEWDDPERGRHSGSLDGHLYFTPTTPESCTFLKAAKLSTGGRRTFSEAFQQRYTHEARDETHRTQRQIVGGGHVHIEDRDRSDVGRDVVDVSGMGVASIGDLREVKHAKEVYLGRSLISRVEDVLQVLKGVPSCRVLDVRRNALIGEGMGVAHALEVLILNYCKVDVDGVRCIVEKLESLKELRAYACKLYRLRGWCNVLQRLEVADLGDNELTWSEVVGLGELPNLREVYLTSNGLGDSDCIKDIAAEGGFKQLSILGLGENGIGEWSTISALDMLPQLSELRLQGNSVLETENDGLTGRMQVIARIGNLHVLDGSTVIVDERRYSERQYIRWVRRTGGSDISAQHPRFESLVNVYGIDDGQVLRWGMINVAMSVEGGSDIISRPFPSAVPMHKLHRLARNLLHVTYPTELSFAHMTDTIDRNLVLGLCALQKDNAGTHLILKRTDGVS